MASVDHIIATLKRLTIVADGQDQDFRSTLSMEFFDTHLLLKCFPFGVSYARYVV